MKYIKTFTILIIVVILFNACENQSIDSIESKTAVVQGYLHAGQAIDSLKITQSFSYNQLDTTIITLDELDVTFSDFTNQYALTSIGNGIYQSSDVIIEHDKSYRMEFLWEGLVVSAETYVPEKKEARLSVTEVEMPKIESGGFGGSFGTGETLDPIEITWENSEGDYYYVVITNIEDNPEYINDNLAENGGVPGFVSVTEPKIMDFHSINPRRELTHYGTHEIVVFRLNPEYTALYESSGSSSLSLEEPPTNIKNGLGIFTGVSSDTLYLEVKKI